MKGIYKVKSFFKFDPLINSDKRYKFSIGYATKLAQNSDYSHFEDPWDIHSRWPQFHKYYYHYLNSCYTASFFDDGLQNKSFPCFFREPLKIDYIKPALIERGDDIISKILLHPYFQNAIDKPDPLVAARLQRVISFINKAVLASAKIYNLRKAKIMNELRPGIASSVLVKLHEMRIDETIINYPKWHLFKAFELLSGRNFFEINKFTPYTTYLSSKIYGFRFGRNDFNTGIRAKILDNNSVKYFLDKNNIFRLYNDLISDLDDRSPGLHDFINYLDSTADESKKARFWLFNNKISIGAIASLVS